MRPEPFRLPALAGPRDLRIARAPEHRHAAQRRQRQFLSVRSSASAKPCCRASASAARRLPASPRIEAVDGSHDPVLQAHQIDEVEVFQLIGHYRVRFR